MNIAFRSAVAPMLLAVLLSACGGGNSSSDNGASSGSASGGVTTGSSSGGTSSGGSTGGSTSGGSTGGSSGGSSGGASGGSTGGSTGGSAGGSTGGSGGGSTGGTGGSSSGGSTGGTTTGGGGTTTGGTGGSTGGGGSGYDVTVTRTTYGIPHIKANDYGSLGYGYGYAFAEDNLCTMLEDYVAIRGERSRYFGGSGTYSIPAVPVTANNVDSDFFWKLVADDAAVQRFKNAATPEVRQIGLGYRDGFNRYIAELKAGQHPGRQSACANAAWLLPIDENDVYRRYVRLAVIASSSALETEIATAAPPALGASSADTPAAEQAALASATPNDQPFARIRTKKFGSNMYALGTQATGGQPIVYGNPHFPWTGTERLYLAHLTMPGTMDIEGVSLYGVPLVLIGFNDKLAWSHTVSTAYRFSLYQLQLNPAKPTQYLYNGTLTDMTAVPLSVDVLGIDGKTVTTQTRTLYKSQYGPMLEIKLNGVPVLGWNNAIGFTLRDANLENDRLINQYFRWNQAQSFDEFKALHKSVLGTPWVNTVASGPGGDAYYGDITVVPNVSDAKAAACKPPINGTLVNALMPGLPILQGGRTDCQWDTDADAPVPGIFGPSHLPTLERPDYVANMNDSYWLTNPRQPVTGYARIIGDEGTARSLRTRQGILQVERRLAGNDGLAGNTFDLPTLQQIVLSAQVYSGELAHQAVQENLCPKGLIYNNAQICAALAQWDNTASLSSIGVPEWQEFWNNVNGISGNYWKTPFDISDPVNTPRDLNTALLSVRNALHDAQTKVQGTGIDFNAPFSAVQHSAVNDTSIPIFGAAGAIGAFTVADTDGLSSSGYGVNYGNSYIQTVTWDGGGVHAEGFLTYSQSTDPANPHFKDFTQAYSQKHWYRFPFHDAEIAAAQESVMELIGTPASP